MKLNISNILTLARIIIIPIIVICIYLKGPFYGWVAFILFCLASITDYFDGYIARIRNEITNFGTFLDPIADKLLVAAVILILTSKEVTIESTFSPTANLSVFCSLFSFAKLDFLINQLICIIF